MDLTAKRRKQRQRDRRRAQGKCPRCGRPADAGRTRCLACRQQSRVTRICTICNRPFIAYDTETICSSLLCTIKQNRGEA